MVKEEDRLNSIAEWGNGLAYWSHEREETYCYVSPLSKPEEMVQLHPLAINSLDEVIFESNLLDWFT